MPTKIRQANLVNVSLGFVFSNDISAEELAWISGYGCLVGTTSHHTPSENNLSNDKGEICMKQKVLEF